MPEGALYTEGSDTKTTLFYMALFPCNSSNTLSSSDKLAVHKAVDEDIGQHQSQINQEPCLQSVKSVRFGSDSINTQMRAAWLASPTSEASRDLTTSSFS